MKYLILGLTLLAISIILIVISFYKEELGKPYKTAAEWNKLHDEVIK